MYIAAKGFFCFGEYDIIGVTAGEDRYGIPFEISIRG